MTLPAMLQIVRPTNVIITGVTVYFGGLIASGGNPLLSPDLLLASISAALVAAGGNALNDCFDLAADLINRPGRVLPAGRLSRWAALAWGWTLTMIGVAIGFWIGILPGAIAFGVAVLLWRYNVTLKKQFLVGNLAVAVCGGAAFIYGGVAVGSVSTALIPAAFAFLIHFAREIVKDIEDMTGDFADGARTIPIVSGQKAAATVAASTLILLAISTLVPYLSQVYSLKYLILVSLFVALPSLVIAGYLLKGMNESGISRVSSLLKIIMITGLISLYVG